MSVEDVFGKGGRFELSRIDRGCSEQVSLGRTKDGVFVMVLEAPASNKENRWNYEFSKAVHEAFDAVEDAVKADPPRTPAALLAVSRSEKFFSNGIDPAGMRKASKEERRAMDDLIMPAFARPILLDMPTICAIGGHAYGAGIMFALGFDYRLMRSDRGYACAIEVAIGINTPSPEFTLFAHSVPQDTFYQMTLLGEKYNGLAAEKAGIVQASVPGDKLLSAAAEKASQLAKLTAAGAMGYYKRELKGFVADEIFRFTFPKGQANGNRPIPVGLDKHVRELVNGNVRKAWGMRHRELENQEHQRLIGKSFL